jgi:hypothetical protein
MDGRRIEGWLGAIREWSQEEERKHPDEGIPIDSSETQAMHFLWSWHIT